MGKNVIFYESLNLAVCPAKGFFQYKWLNCCILLDSW